jgi:PTS system N-acetylglucosamine-specific IIC component
MRKAIEALQPLGRALMLPIAVLPVAALLLRLGQPDLLDIAFVSAAGDAIFAHLGLLFAVGVATGFARDGNGAAALAGVVCFLVTGQGLKLFIDVPPDAVASFSGDAVKMASTAYVNAAAAKLEVPIGILSGLIGGNFYNRFSGVKLPEYLAFFSGRRFVPIASGVAGLALAGLIGLGYEHINAGMTSASRGIVDAGGPGLFVFGVVNRLLLVTGLHHIINNIAWFVVGDFEGTTGDLRRFFAGDPSAGAFMSGFFPVMMFGLPAACLAMYHEALPGRRKAVGGMLFSLALTSFLTGVTEPIEFSFMFLAPLLYAIHAVLTGISMALMQALNVHLGFGFSAGLFDYVLNYGKATNPLLLLPVGAVYALVYYGLFRIVIRKLDLKTPGRESDEPEAAPRPAGAAVPRGAAFVAALGGSANLVSIDACTTRLRLIVNDQSLIDEAALKTLGARGVIKPSDRAVQVVLGPIADAVAMEMRDGAGVVAASPVREAEAASIGLPHHIVAALGGDSNIRLATRLHGRIRVELADAARADIAGAGADYRAAIALSGNVVHLLEYPAA